MVRANADSQIRFAAQAFLLGVASLFAASFCGIGYRGDLLEHSFQPFALLALTALAMGIRNAAVRKLAIPDLTTTVLTLTITGIGADSPPRERQQPETGEKYCVGGRDVLGGGIGCSRHTLLDLSGSVACDCNLHIVLCSVVPLCTHCQFAVTVKLDPWLLVHQHAATAPNVWISRSGLGFEKLGHSYLL
jgi:hypothetical protein